ENMADLVFEAVQEADGGYCAECLTENIFTQSDTWDELRKNVVEATAAFFFTLSGTKFCRSHEAQRALSRIAIQFIMKIPRDVSGERFAEALCRRWQYSRIHQSGSHIILETAEPSQQRIANPD